MKLNIFKGILACGAILSLAACSENTWNEDNLDGFEVPNLNGGGASQVIQYTLTSSDYSAIAKNSDNVAMATETGVLDLLQAVGTHGYFSESIQPREYVTPWLNTVQSNTKYPFYMLNNRATIQLYYKVAENQPAELLSIENAPQYEVTEADYKAVYGSDENYAMSFAPSYLPEKYVPGFLATAYPDAKADDFVYVTYENSSVDPNFGGNGGVNPDVPEEPNLGDLTMGETYEIHGQLMAICNQGAVLTTTTGSTLLYDKNIAWSDMKVGDKATVEGAANNYYGALQLQNLTVKVTGNEAAQYPTPVKWTGADVDKHMTEVANHKSTYPMGPVYVEVVATLKVSGNYYNFNVDGATNQIAFYQPTNAQKAAVADGQTYTLTGYAVSTGKTYVNLIPTAINGTPLTPAPAYAPQSRAVAYVPSQAVNAVYKYNGSKWAPAADVIVLQSSDYTAMGVKDLNASKAAEFLPIYLKNNYPYAAKGDTKYVVYKYYDATDKKTYNQHCDRLTFDGTAWVMDTQETKMAQFVKSNGKWMFDPTIYINYPDSKTDAASLAFYNACVSWVWNNINLKVPGISDQTLADWPQTGKVATFGWCWGSNGPTQEGYGGASAYYCNYDNRVYTLKSYLGDDFYNENYGSLDDDEVLELTEKRFCEEVARGALEAIYPDVMPGSSFDQYYEITLVQYSPKQSVSIKYLVTGKGQFKFVECPVWNLKAE
ncbi:MAG: hypothetical protein NC343_07865 [Muribaculum sp.]|nr:hypothetical protein [Muribaculaceae bacterium]MCM1081652.1 hypothetical protein [Muribaculum sp.]